MQQIAKSENHFNVSELAKEIHPDIKSCITFDILQFLDKYEPLQLNTLFQEIQKELLKSNETLPHIELINDVSYMFNNIMQSLRE